MAFDKPESIESRKSPTPEFKAIPSFLLLSLAYTVALLLIVSALQAQQAVDGHLTINFEYRAF